MAAPEHPPQGPSSVNSIGARIEKALETFLDNHGGMLADIDPQLYFLAEEARNAVLAGGKRIRPTFAYWGWRATDSHRPSASVDAAERAHLESQFVKAAASLELLHAGALVHDDLMDASDTRRGQPSSHRRFEARHTQREWPSSPTTFAAAASILLGDLLLSWAGEMFSAAALSLSPARAAAASVQFDLMRTEVVAGQFLDSLAQARGLFDTDAALRVIRYKTSKYTVERPLLLGAAASGATAATFGALSSYGQNLGEAFQLRDDLLGVFGDPKLTGKPAGDDLREGKRTVLLALAMQEATEADQAALQSAVGDPELDQPGVEALREILVRTGAVRAVEQRIAERAADAQACLDSSIAAPAREALLSLAEAAAHRSA